MENPKSKYYKIPNEAPRALARGLSLNEILERPYSIRALKSAVFRPRKYKSQIQNPKLSFGSICSVWILILVVFVVFDIGISLCFCNETVIQYSSEEDKFKIPFGKTYNYADVLVKRAVDGDTLLLESGERVRLIGIDTPEMHESDKLRRDSQRSGQDIKTIRQMGRRSYEFTRALVEGKRVNLEFDAEKYDKYDRLLAYVYLKDGTFINAKIVEEGYASLMTYPPNVKYADLFLKLYRQAQEAKRGLWKEE